MTCVLIKRLVSCSRGMPGFTVYCNYLMGLPVSNWDLTI